MGAELDDRARAFWPAFVVRFWARVDKDGPVPAHCPDLGPCWLWLGARASNGYGNVGFMGRTLRPHRVSWEIANGRGAGDGCVLHRCDVRHCMKPTHLFIGTRLENMRDAASKGRIAHGDRHSSRTHPEAVARGARHSSRTHPERVARGDRNGARTRPDRVARGDRHASRTHPESVCRGERNGAAKLTDDAVREIRRERASGALLTTLAARFGVSPSLIGLVGQGKIWRHVMETERRTGGHSNADAL